MHRAAIEWLVLSGRLSAKGHREIFAAAQIRGLEVSHWLARAAAWAPSGSRHEAAASEEMPTTSTPEVTLSRE